MQAENKAGNLQNGLNDMGEQMKEAYSLKYLCEHQDRMYLLQEWDRKKNAPLTPETVHRGSHRKVWWRCGAGHVWQAEVRSRAGGAKCPYCTGRILWMGGNDLASVNAALAAQWDKEKNGDLTPDHVLAGSRRYVWWKCEKGHSWRASVLSRSRGTGCPVCTGKTVLPGQNDLAVCFPDLAAQWDTARNGSLRPEQVTSFSNRKVWWKCGLGHEWQAVIAARVAERAGCPYCAGRRVLAGFNDLTTIYPEIAAQWDDTLNGTLTPEMVTAGSNQRVWWKCSEGHVWKAVIYSRTGKKKCGCPICAGKKPAKRRPAEPISASILR